MCEIRASSSPHWQSNDAQGLGLCHGISGNAYTLLSAYRCTGDERQFKRAVQYGLFMADHWQELLNVPNRPLSLYEVCFNVLM